MNIFVQLKANYTVNFVHSITTGVLELSVVFVNKLVLCVKPKRYWQISLCYLTYYLPETNVILVLNTGIYTEV